MIGIGRYGKERERWIDREEGRRGGGGGGREKKG